MNDLQTIRDYFLFVLAVMVMTLIFLITAPSPSGWLLVIHFVAQIAFWVLFFLYSRLLIDKYTED